MRISDWSSDVCSSDLGGIDYPGIVSAVITNLKKDGRPVGASTITQQVAKNLLLTGEVSYRRKIREAILATRIEAALSKEQILELYLNEIPLGRRSFGEIGRASCRERVCQYG